MSDDALRDILKRADATAEAPPKMPADLAARVRRRAARRTRARVMGGCVAAAAIVLAAGGTAYFRSASDTNIPCRDPAASAIVNADPEQHPAQADIAAIRAELGALRREADTRLAVARRTREILARIEKADAASEPKREVPDVVANARREVDRAAYALVAQADRMCREMDLCDSAVVKYERVIRLFPETPWATVAKHKLDEIRQKGELS